MDLSPDQPLDIEMIVDDIFSDNVQTRSKIEKYKQKKERIENDLKDHIYINYTSFISLSNELAQIQKLFTKLRTNFVGYDPLLKSLNTIIYDSKYDEKNKKALLSGKSILDTEWDAEEFMEITDFNQTINSINNNTTINNNQGNISNISSIGSDISSKDKVSTYEFTDRIEEVIDKLDMFIYEKNYDECKKLILIFQELKQSKNKYSELMNNFDIRRTIDVQYKRLIESLTSDIVVKFYLENSGTSSSSNNKSSSDDLFAILIQIGQINKAKEVFFDIQSRQLQENTRKIIDTNKYYDIEFLESITEDFVNMLIKYYDEYLRIFKISLENKNYDLTSSYIPWVFKQTEIFYYMIHQFIFSNINFEVSMGNLRTVLDKLSELEKKGIGLSTFFQRLACPDIEDYLDEAYDIIQANLRLLGGNDDWAIYNFFQILGVLEYNIEYTDNEFLYNPNDPHPNNNNNKAKESIFKNQSIDGIHEQEEDNHSGDSSDRKSLKMNNNNNNEMYMNTTENLEIDLIGTNIYNIFMTREFHFKFSKTINYFWNAVFYLLDTCFNCQDNYFSIFSCHTFTSVIIIINDLFNLIQENYFNLSNEESINNTNNNENELLCLLVSAYQSAILCSNMNNIISLKFPKQYNDPQLYIQLVLGKLFLLWELFTLGDYIQLQFTQILVYIQSLFHNNRWIDNMNIFNEKYDKIRLEYLKISIISKMPKLILENTMTYTQKTSESKTATPSKIFIKFAMFLDTIDETFRNFTSCQEQQYTLYLTINCMLSIIEFCFLYLQNQPSPKSNLNNQMPKQLGNITFPTNKALLELIKFDLNAIQMQIIRSKFKLNDCNNSGFAQLILDINFLACYYNKKIKNINLLNETDISKPIKILGSQTPKENTSYYIDTDELLARFVNIYCFENLKQANNYEYKQEAWRNFCEEYIRVGYIKDKISILREPRRSIIISSRIAL